MQEAISIQNICPHTHKAPLVLENGELSGSFLSRHFEQCSTCSDKIEALKIDRNSYLKQIPFVSAPKEIKVIFKQESNELSVRVKRRIRSMKMKRFEELTSGLKDFSLDVRKALLSMEFTLGAGLVLSVWAYLKFIN
ncbi:hypothetical protein A9Q84_08775 [Halobacteriovorax marinus]|uniref:Uncharacterized protein n=1 Tax=Halobacteriovorax marinus TaxID=97084 RepID=A0A1Y5F6B3_9BACT|nr:hypothetical protein A9Q84_08775 [Halobacteriovorax marinus]